MLNFFRLHWFDIGIFFSVPIFLFISFTKQSELTILLWLSLITLFFHQFEEYRYPGYFPGMMNVAMFSSQKPDRYPLNTNTAMIVNTTVGWLLYFLAAVFNQEFIWLAIATILVSLGNVLVHTIIFNIKGKTKYNPGMLTALILFLPLALFFLYLVIEKNFATIVDWTLGIILGIILNFVGVIKVIEWLKDENTPYVFPKRSLIPSQRN